MRFLHGHKAHRGTPEERFWRNIVKRKDGCWEWTAARTCGYGQFSVNGTPTRTHRYAYKLLVGPIPEGMHLDHLCRNRACANPDHLEPVTCLENVRRSPIHVGARTHCPAGHQYAGTDLRIDSRTGARCCRACGRDRARARYWRERLAT